MKIWVQISQQIEKRSLRERSILLAVALLIVLLLTDTLLTDPDRREIVQQTQRLTSQHAELNTLKTQETELLQSLSADPNIALRERATYLEAEVLHAREALDQEFARFISPDQMNSALRALVGVTEGVSLHSLRSLPTEIVFSAPETDPDSNAEADTDTEQTDLPEEVASGVYRRGVELELTGNYHGLVRYLDMLSELPWVISWEQVQVLSDKYPDTLFRLRLYTLTLDEGWLRV
ncbi:hypothetical protein LH51_07765 [Nitrincola sp. A-D6]|uniref:hypothetical protein n=1 Tax=Nitrincola sp. A-D6 TaxID=1545442 RepID=UPI00051FBC1D|nr:hypothetical protein [Nitrincola sp. A-D6]KGK42403.1 hypothetical protein LH51_07765 [Nitrincola sp. A-D6]